MKVNKEKIAQAVLSAPKATALRPGDIGDPKAKKRKTLKNYTLPDDCPVKALGTRNGIFVYLDNLNQLRELPAGKHGRLELEGLFAGCISFLHKNYPRYSKPDKSGASEIVGFRAEDVAAALMDECATKGIFDPREAIRGPGCWKAQDGELIMHCGDAIYQGLTKSNPGKIGHFVYPAAAPKPRPTETENGMEAAQELLALFKTWNWSRPELDPALLMGWIGAAILGGALDWRPLVWITGDKSTGKSTLHKVLKSVLGTSGLISASDASAAGLWQSVGHASLPIALDEQESEEDNRRNNNLIKLARHAATGGVVLRGSSDHRHADFTVRSCFLFSSILIPPMLAQDISRMAILQLSKIVGTLPPILEATALETMGAIFRRRLQEQWPRFADTLAAYRTMLNRAGHGARGADQFGTLLACYDLLSFNTVPDSDTLSEWSELLQAANLEEMQDDVADHERCTAHLLTSIVDVFRNGTRKSIGHWIEIAVGYKHGDGGEANSALSTFGLKVHTCKGKHSLRVAHYHQGLAKLFEGTQWGGRAGTSGVWVQALKRINGAQSLAGIRFDGVKTRCTEIPLDQVMTREANYE